MDMSVEYFRKTFQLSQASAQPIYTQLAEYLRHQIKSGVLKPGDKMLGENEIVAVLGISRTTVRQALNRLVKEGLLIRYRGKGSFIAEPRLKRSINYLYNFTENIRASGAVPSSVVLHCGVEEAEADVCEKLKLGIGDRKVFHLCRLRLADNEPLILETSYIPYYLCPGIEQTDFSTASLYRVLEDRYGVTISHAEETIEAIALGKQNGDILQSKANAPGYKIQRISFMPSGYLCEYTSSVTRADKCVFKLDLYNSRLPDGGGMNFQREMICK